MASQIELIGAPAELWMDDRRLPERMVVAAHRWVVIDEPTVLETIAPSPALTHPPAGYLPATIRFTAREYEEGDVLVFDVERAGGDHWQVKATYA